LPISGKQQILPAKPAVHTQDGLLSLYEFLIKRLKRFIRPQNCGQRPLPLKNEVNTFLTAAQAVCRVTA